MNIRTPDEWWACLNEGWESFKICHSNAWSVPTYDDDGPARFEDARLTIGHPKFWEIMSVARDQKDHATVWSGLELIWEAAPDRADIHLWPRWGDLCDLCSEIWVFEPEDVVL